MSMRVTALLQLDRPGADEADGHFTTRELCVLGAAGAMSFVLMLLKLPTPFAWFLKYDPSDVPPTLCAMAVGPIAGLMTVMVRILLRVVTSAGDPIGLAMNLVASGSFVMVAGHLGRFPANRRKQTRALLAATVAMTAIMIPVNFYVLQITNYVPPRAIVGMLWIHITPFNILKGLTNSILVVALWSRLRSGVQSLVR